MTYFDCCCEIGPRNGKDLLTPWSTADVLRWMDHCGIAGALVVHTLSIHNDPIQARKALAKEIARAPKRLFPVWAVLPPDAGDGDRSPSDLLRSMARENVRAVTLFPRAHNWPLSLSLIGPTLEALERARILTLLDFSELPDGNAGGFNHAAYLSLDEILTAYPKLPLLLQGTWWSSQRIVTALMARHANLHVEFSSYQVNRGIEEYARRFGAERLLFGTGLPMKSAGAARAFVDYAQVSKQDRARIAGGNLSRLLGGVSPAGAPRRKPDPLRDRAVAGKPLRVPVLDAHCHVLHEGGQGAGAVVMYRGDAAGMVEIKDVLGIQKTAIMSWVGPAASDPIDGNDIVARALRKFPRRYLGVVYLNPTHLSSARLMAEVRKRVEKQGFIALKPYLKLGRKYTDPLYKACWEYADRHGLYSLLHTEGAAGPVESMAELAKAYPRAQWVIAHTGGSFGYARRVVALMKEHANVWAELTLTASTNGVIEWMVSEVGDDRILFGTDAPMRDPRPQFGWVVWADLPAASRARILGGNFQRLLAMRRTLHEK
jgi:predicted TIM-barrel fold metal-dependent hydrolase